MATAIVQRAAIVSLAATLLFPSATAAVAPAIYGSGLIRFGASSEQVIFTGRGPSGGQKVVVVDRTILGPVVMHVELDCLRIVGNEATVSGIITQSSDPTIEGFEALLQIRDNGEGASEPRDEMSPVLIHEVGIGPNCLVPAEFDLVPLEGGNLEISS